MPERSFITEYERDIKKGILDADPMQHQLAQHFESLRQELLRRHQRLGGLTARVMRIPPLKPQGLYIWGKVGRGKTMLMQRFYDSLPTLNKRRIHFHAFMLEVHDHLHELRGKDDQTHHLLRRVARLMARDLELLCFDEFQVQDIADAMLLSSLFEAIFELGVTVVATSNRPPADLYKDGLQRQRFLPFIDLLKSKLEIFNLDGSEDYRQQTLENLAETYLIVKGKAAEKKAEDFLKDTFERLSQNASPEQQTLKIKGRKVVIEKTSDDIAWATFNELCAKPLGAEDYQTLAKTFTVLLLQGIPQLSKEKRNEAKRFVTLIDELYEHKTKLVCTAAAAPEKLYPEGDGSVEFERTASRLREMQGADWFHAEHET